MPACQKDFRISTRGHCDVLDITPQVSRIVSESGHLVYDSSVVYAKDAMRDGMVKYSLSPFGLSKGTKMGSFHCTALNTTSFEGTDVVIADEDAAKILGNPLTIEAIRHCRVVILAAEKR